MLSVGLLAAPRDAPAARGARALPRLRQIAPRRTGSAAGVDIVRPRPRTILTPGVAHELANPTSLPCLRQSADPRLGAAGIYGRYFNAPKERLLDPARAVHPGKYEDHGNGGRAGESRRQARAEGARHASSACAAVRDRGWDITPATSPHLAAASSIDSASATVIHATRLTEGCRRRSQGHRPSPACRPHRRRLDIMCPKSIPTRRGAAASSARSSRLG